MKSSVKSRTFLAPSSTTFQGQLNICPCVVQNPERNQDMEDLFVPICLGIRKALATVPSGKFLVKLEEMDAEAKSVRWQGSRQMRQKFEQWKREMLRNYHLNSSWD